MRIRRDPETKEALLDRLLMADFDGDIRYLGSAPARIKRLAPHMLRLEFPDSGQMFDITVHKPRKPEKAERRSFSPEVTDWTVGPEPQKPAPLASGRKRRGTPTTQRSQRA